MRVEVSRDAVRHVAGLARLEVAEEDLDALTADVRAILGAVARLLDTDLPAEPPPRRALRLRRDVPDPTDPTPVRACAPAFREGLFALPRAVPSGDRDR